MSKLRSRALGNGAGEELSRAQLKNVLGGVVPTQPLCVASADCGNGTGVTCVGFGKCGAADGVGCYTLSSSGTLDVTTC